MTLPGVGFIALWNDVTAGRLDYDNWHTIEHLPQRLTVEGFLRGLRYIRSEGPLPQYFTLYALSDLEALNREAYRRLLREPTPWTQSMRPDLYNFLRLVCRTVASDGVGVGGHAAVRPMPLASSIGGAALCGRLLHLEGVSAVHYGEVALDAHPLGLKVESAFDPEARSVLVVEGYSAEGLRAACETVELEEFGSGSGLPGWTYYKLAFALAKNQAAAGDAEGFPGWESAAPETV